MKRKRRDRERYRHVGVFGSSHPSDEGCGQATREDRERWNFEQRWIASRGRRSTQAFPPFRAISVAYPARQVYEEMWDAVNAYVPHASEGPPLPGTWPFSKKMSPDYINRVGAVRLLV